MAEEPFALTNPGPAPTAAEYDGIRTAVMETERGRWFLTEYARRNRNADTQVLLAALERIEALIRREPPADEKAAPSASPSTQTEPPAAAAAKPHGDEADSSTAPRNIANAVENATAAIRSAAERLQDISWHLRERQYDDKFCDEIEARTAEISRACVVLDVAAAAAHDVATLIAAPEHHAAASAVSPPAQASAPQAAASNEEQALAAEASEIPWYLEQDSSEAEGDWGRSELGHTFEAEATPALALWGLPDREPEEEPALAEPAPIEPAVSIVEPVTQVVEPPPPEPIWPQHPPAALSAEPAPKIEALAPAPAPTSRTDHEPDAPPKFRQASAPEPARGGWLSSLLNRIANGEEDEDGEAQPHAATAATKVTPAVVTAPTAAVETVAAVVAKPAAATVETPVPAPVETMAVIETVAVAEPAAAAPSAIVESTTVEVLRAAVAAMVVETRSEAISTEASIELKPESTDAAVNGTDDDPAGFLLEPLPAAFGMVATPLHLETKETDTPKPRDPLAPLRAMSEEEKIALFS